MLKMLPPIARVLFVASLLSLFAAWILLAPVGAQHRSLGDTELRVAGNHAVLSINEAGFDSPADEAAIWQTLENIAGGQAASIRDISDAMDRHSGRATGAEAHRTHDYGNHRWTRDLGPDCSEPARWSRSYPSLPWGSIYHQRCRDVFARSQTLVRRRPRVSVCRGRPITWGGRYGLDSGILERRNQARASRGRSPLVPLACRYRGAAPLNGFYGVEQGAGDGA
jgi:hypothetical protein